MFLKRTDIVPDGQEEKRDMNAEKREVFYQSDLGIM